MSKIQWDQSGERFFEAGVDRGVLYISNEVGVPWNGLTSIEEKSNDRASTYMLDGVKYLNQAVLGDFSAHMTAFTYPDELEGLTGSRSYAPGLLVQEQPPRSFSLTYRTRMGNDLTGIDYGYKLHIVYNVVAISDAVTHETRAEQGNPIDFGWDLQTTPEYVAGYRPTAHVILDSTRLSPRLLQKIEAILYGTESSDPHLPSLGELVQVALDWAVIIIDNGNGTWTAVAPDESESIRMISPTMFMISNVDALFLDRETYEISTTPLR